jgi:hypothetical protein
MRPSGALFIVALPLNEFEFDFYYLILKILTLFMGIYNAPHLIRLYNGLDAKRR